MDGNTWVAEDGELKVFAEGDCDPRIWRKFKHVEVTMVDTREHPGLAVAVGTTQAIELVHRMRTQWNQHADEVRRLNAMKDSNGAIRGSLRTDRNASCACGSGVKAKKCCRKRGL